MTRLPKERVRILSSGRIPIYTPQYGRVTGAEASACLWEAHAALKIDKKHLWQLSKACVLSMELSLQNVYLVETTP